MNFVISILFRSPLFPFMKSWYFALTYTEQITTLSEDGN